MKIRKILLLPIILVLVAIFTASIVFAEESRTFGIVSIREGGYGYQANSKNVWKIVEYEGNNFTYDNAIYCLKAGQGFGDNAHIEKREYNISYGMKQFSTIPDSIKKILPSDEKKTATINGEEYTYTDYNAVLALLDNFYLPKDKNALELKDAMFSTVFPDLEKDEILLTNDDIEVVQQLAIWYFSNPDETDPYHMETLPALQLTTVEGGQGPFDTTLDDLDPTWNRQSQAAELYTFLIEHAKMMADLYGYDDVRGYSVIPVEIFGTEITNEIIKGKIVVGPFKVADLETGLAYDLTVTVKDDSENEKEYKLLDSNKNEVAEGTTVKDLVNQEFYVAISEDENIQKLNFEIKATYNEKTMTFYTVGGSELLEQPVVVIENKEKEIVKNQLQEQ